MKKVRRSTVFCLNCGLEEDLPNSRARGYKFCSEKCMSIYFTKIKFKAGDKINNWEIIDNKPVRKYGRTYIKVKCTCGSNIIKDLPIKNIETPKTKGCEYCSRGHGYKGYEYITGSHWCQIKNGAIKRGLEFDITIEQSNDLLKNQDFKCALSGVDIKTEEKSIRTIRYDSRKYITASLDRIDSNKGYTIDNIQWVHKDINRMKNKFSQEIFINYCKLVCQKN